MAAIRELTMEQQEVFLSFYLIGNTATEIATATGRSRDAIEQTLARSRKRLRQILVRKGESEEEINEYLCVLRATRAEKLPDLVVNAVAFERE